MPQVSRQVLNISSPPMDTLNAARRLIEQEVGSIVNCGQAITDFGPPDVAIEQMQRQLGDLSIHTYTSDAGIDPLRQLIARSISERFSGKQVEFKRVIVSGGANHAFFLVCAAIRTAVFRVGLLSPYFPNHKMAIESCGGTAIEILPEEGTFRYEPRSIAEAIRRHSLRAVVVTNPSNPTGKVFTAEEVMSIHSVCKECGVFLICDEVYRNFTYGPPFVSAAALDDAEGSVIVIGSFSKECGMTGWRVGWMVVPENLFDHVIKIQDCSLICAPHASQILAYYSLDSLLRTGARCYESLVERRNVLAELFDSHKGFRTAPMDGAFFLWFRPPVSVDSRKEAENLMRHARICVVPGANFGSRWESWFRLSYGCQGVASFLPAVTRMIEILKSR